MRERREDLWQNDLARLTIRAAEEMYARGRVEDAAAIKIVDGMFFRMCCGECVKARRRFSADDDVSVIQTTADCDTDFRGVEGRAFRIGNLAVDEG